MIPDMQCSLLFGEILRFHSIVQPDFLTNLVNGVGASHLHPANSWSEKPRVVIVAKCQ